MSKMSELSMIMDEMIHAGNAMVKAATALKNYYSSADEKEPKAGESQKGETALSSEVKIKSDTPATEKKVYTYEEVRKICAGKSAADDGAHKREVLDIVKKYADGRTLSKVDPSQYAALVAEVEVIGNAG